MTIKELKTLITNLPDDFEIKASIIESDLGDLEITDILQGMDENGEEENLFILTLASHE